MKCLLERLLIVKLLLVSCICFSQSDSSHLKGEKKIPTSKKVEKITLKPEGKKEAVKESGRLSSTNPKSNSVSKRSNIPIVPAEINESPGTSQNPKKLDIDDWADIISAGLGIIAIILSAYSYRGTYLQFRLSNQSYLSVRFNLSYNIPANYPRVAPNEIQTSTIIDGYAPLVIITNVGKMPATYRVLSCQITHNGSTSELTNPTSDILDGILMPGESLTFNTNQHALGRETPISGLSGTEFEFQFQANYNDIGLKTSKSIDRTIKMIIDGTLVHVRNLKFNDRLG